MKRRISRSTALLLVIALCISSAMVVSAQDGIDATAEPTVATVNLGGTENSWLDPFLISTMGGAPEGTTVDASTLGEDCVGLIPTTPDVVLNWTENTNTSSLRLFFVGDGDPTMVVVTPDGSILCNDDLNPLVLNPMVDIDNPATGRYAIFMGSFEENAIEPGILVISGSDLTPETFSLSALIYESPIVTTYFDGPIPLSDLLLDQLPTGIEAPTALAAGFGTAQQAEIVSGSSIPAFNIDLGNPMCTGFIDAVPNYVFEWTGDSVPLRLFFESAGDATLVVRGPDGAFLCADVSAGGTNLNPLLDFTAEPGRYVVYVGTFSPDSAITGTLTVTEDTTLEPDALTFDMLGQ